jgi:hypothetical protein
VQPFTPSDRQCRDDMTQARQQVRKPPLLGRESTSKPCHISIVDRRKAGCAAMFIARSPADIRPLPVPSGEPTLVMPLSERR